MNQNRGSMQVTSLNGSEQELFNGALDVAVTLAASKNEQHKGLGQIIAGLCAIINKHSDQIPWIAPYVDPIELGKSYLVWTNGREYGDNHIHLWPAPMITHNLRPEITRGKILFIAKVTEPIQ